MAFIKICGIRSHEEARLALDHGATALGFLVGTTHRAEDALEVQDARTLIAALPPNTPTVMVTHLTDPALIADLTRSLAVSMIQVHGALPVDGMIRLSAMLPRLRLIKAVHVAGPEAIATAKAYAPVADSLLLDSRTSDRLGGTGRTHDWTISRAIVAALPDRPVYLAGGLTQDNVADAIRTVRPAGVNVNSGVENASGWKDAAKLEPFIARAARQLAGD